jgi:hypothetical protein
MPRTVLAVALLLAACGAPAAQGTGANAAASGSGGSSDTDCHDETPTGSNLTRKICRTPDQSKDERDAAGRYMKTNRPNPAGAPN